MHLFSRILLCNAACSVLAIEQDDNNSTDLLQDQDEPIMPALNVAMSKTINVEKKYMRWPKRNRIPFSIHKSYTPIEATLIRSAVSQIMSDLNYWITFAYVPTNSSEYKILITPLKVDNTLPEDVCYSFPGMLTIAPKLSAKGIKEQRLVLARGPNGCMDGTIHSIIKHLVVVLGKRNEHERGDRAKYIQLFPENLAPAGQKAYRMYTSTEAVWSLFPYDYCSVTHAAQTDFAMPGKLAFSVLQAPFFIPKLNRLSETDCRLLLLLYGGDPSACSPLVCSALVGVKLTINPASTASPPITHSRPSSTMEPATTQPTTPTITESSTNGLTTVCYSFPTPSPVNSSGVDRLPQKLGLGLGFVTPPMAVVAPLTAITANEVTSTSSLGTASTTSTATSTMTTFLTTSPATGITSPTTLSATSIESTTETLVIRDISLTDREERASCPENLCSSTIDHAALYWDGITSILFSGNCTQRVDRDFQLIGPPLSITEALPGALIYGTIQAAWTNLQDGQYRLHVVDRNGVQRGCSAAACVREEQTARPTPSSSLFAVQSGQSQIFRMFSLDGSSNIVDMARQQIRLSVSKTGNNTSTEHQLVHLDTAWMYYNTKGENSVAIIGSDQDGRKHVAEINVDLTQIPATFTLKPGSSVVPMESKLHPCA